MTEDTIQNGACGEDRAAVPGYVASDDVLTAELEEEAVLLDMDTKRYYRLNETGSWIWRGLQRELDRQQLIGHLRNRFDVGAAEAEKEVDAFIARLADKGLIRTSCAGPAGEDPEDHCDDRTDR